MDPVPSQAWFPTRVARVFVPDSALPGELTLGDDAASGSTATLRGDVNWIRIAAAHQHPGRPAACMSPTGSGRCSSRRK